MAQLTITPSTGNLGTITNDIQYTVTSDTAGTLVASIEVNGALFNTQTLTSGTPSTIYVTQLPTGANTIILTVNLTESGGTVTSSSVTWTYTKNLINIPTSGNVSNLSINGQPTFPTTLAEAIKVPPALGNTLDQTLDLLRNSVTYTSTAQPKYSKVTVDLSTAQVGDIVNLPYNGVMVPHIVVQIGNPDASMYDSSCNGVWLLRQNCVANGQWNSSNVSTLSGSTIMTTMAGYVSQYDSTVSSQIQTVKIPYCTGGGNTTINTLANGLQCQMFPLSGYEVGGTTSTSPYFPVDGTKLSYFESGSGTSANNKRIAYLNGSPANWWLRSPSTYNNNTNSVWCVFSTGVCNYDSANLTRSVRPCFILPTTFSATYYVDASGGVHAEQEYTQAGDFYDLWGNIIPSTKIVTGSYVGTGLTSSALSLDFGFKPLLVVITATTANDSNGVNASISWINGTSVGLVTYNRVVYNEATITWTDTGLSWISTSGAQYMLNNRNTTYNYVAIG